MTGRQRSPSALVATGIRFAAQVLDVPGARIERLLHALQSEYAAMPSGHVELATALHGVRLVRAWRRAGEGRRAP